MKLSKYYDSWQKLLHSPSLMAVTLRARYTTRLKLTGITPFWLVGIPSVTKHCSPTSLQWRHNGLDGISNLQLHDCLLNRLFKAQIKENIKAPRHWFCEGNSPVTGEFPTQRTSNAENVSIWRRHYVSDENFHRFFNGHWQSLAQPSWQANACLKCRAGRPWKSLPLSCAKPRYGHICVQYT